MMVMPGLVHACRGHDVLGAACKTWMAGTSPAMTTDAGPRPGMTPSASLIRLAGILYVGVTNDLVRRVYEHRTGAVAGFTKHYGLKTLVYFETFDDIQSAIQREKNIKHRSRAWKVRLVHQNNPQWLDLYETLT